MYTLLIDDNIYHLTGEALTALQALLSTLEQEHRQSVTIRWLSEQTKVADSGVRHECADSI